MTIAPSSATRLTAAQAAALAEESQARMAEEAKAAAMQAEKDREAQERAQAEAERARFEKERLFAEQRAAVREAALTGKTFLVVSSVIAQPSFWWQNGYRIDELKGDLARERFLAELVAGWRAEIDGEAGEKTEAQTAVLSAFCAAEGTLGCGVSGYLDDWWRQGRFGVDLSGMTLIALVESIRTGSARSLLPWIGELNRVAELYKKVLEAEAKLAPVRRSNKMLPDGAKRGYVINWESAPTVPTGRDDLRASAMQWLATRGQVLLDEICGLIPYFAQHAQSKLGLGILTGPEGTMLHLGPADKVLGPACLESVCDLLGTLGYTTKIGSGWLDGGVFEAGDDVWFVECPPQPDEALVLEVRWGLDDE